MILFQAQAGNVGTCRFDAKGEIQVSGPHEEKSTEAKHRDGAARSSNEAFESTLSKGAASFIWAFRSTRRGRSL